MERGMRRRQPQGRRLPLTVPVNRDETCPMLIRCLWAPGGRHRNPQDFEDLAQGGQDQLLRSEIQIHTWSDATLSEILGLIKCSGGPGSVLACSQGARVSFSMVYPDRHGSFQMCQVGSIAADRADPADDGARSLASMGFLAGDFLDIAIMCNAEPSIIKNQGGSSDGKGMGKGKGKGPGRVGRGRGSGRGGGGAGGRWG